MHILLVEDRPEDAELTKLALFNSNFNGKVHWVENGAVALDFLFDERNEEIVSELKCVLLDINMPLVSGLQVLKKIKSSSLKSIPVVVLTTSKEQSDVKEAYENYVNSYIIKSVNFTEFENSIKEIGNYWAYQNLSPTHKIT